MRRNAGADRDRADANVAIEDVPGSLLGLDERTMAGEGGHGALLKRDLGGAGNSTLRQ